jgi:hypothetical protein
MKRRTRCLKLLISYVLGNVKPMPLTMTTAESTIVIRYTEQIISIGWYLRIGRWPVVIKVTRTRRKGRRHVICEIEGLHWEVDQCLNFVRERTFDRKPFKVDQEDRWESRKNQLLGCLS